MNQLQEHLEYLGYSTEVNEALLEAGFAEECCLGPDLDCFGNMQMELANSALRLRFTKDRDDQWIEVRPNCHETWLSLFQVTELIHPEFFAPDTGRLLVGVDRMMKWVLTDGLPQLLDALGEAQLANSRAITEERSDARFPVRLRSAGVSERAIAQILHASKQARSKS